MRSIVVFVIDGPVILLFTAYTSQLTAPCLLPTVYRLLFTADYLLPTAFPSQRLPREPLKPLAGVLPGDAR